MSVDPELSRDGIDAPPGRESEMGLHLYAALVANGFSERTIFTTLACEVACAAHDSRMAGAFIDALANAARELVPLVQPMRQEQAAEWASKQTAQRRRTKQ
jgi:hypothetical protein